MRGYFFDLPVYRITREEYHKKRDAYVEQNLFKVGSSDEEFLRKRHQEGHSNSLAYQEHLEKTYGGCWEFNEIVGHIRLHILGSQIRGEYFSTNALRITRTRTKTFEYKTHKLAPEVEIEPPRTTKEVLTAIWQYINDCKKELPNRHIDTSRFESICNFVDWEAVYLAYR